MFVLHRERHRTNRIGWLRAAVLGANDGIVSTASLVVGVAAAHSTASDILVAGVAGLVAGLCRWLRANTPPSAPQGQRTLSCFGTKDLHQEVIVPAAHAAFHGETFFARMLLEQRQSEPSEPRQVLGDRSLARS